MDDQNDENVQQDAQPELQAAEQKPEQHEENRDVFSPAGGYPSDPTGRISTDAPELELSDNPSSHQSAGDLDSIKKKALEELAPIIDDLDLSPEEKFHLIMMIVQALDDKSLIEKAYQIAHTIEDEHARAQALYDIVNEINYFTHPKESNNSEDK